MSKEKLCDYCKRNDNCAAFNKSDKSCFMFSPITITEAKLIDLPIMWEETKRDLPRIIQEILETPQMRKLDIHFDATVNEIPILTYTVERYAWGREKKDE